MCTSGSNGFAHLFSSNRVGTATLYLIVKLPIVGKGCVHEYLELEG
jgi:hypothetical protein